MKLKSIVKAVVAAGLLLTVHSPIYNTKLPEINTTYSKITYKKNNNSEYCLVIIKDYHRNPEVQKEIYFTLEDLFHRNNLRLSCLENLFTDLNTKKDLERKIDMKNLTKEQRKEKVFSYINGYDSYSAGLGFELVYDDSIDTRGVEDKWEHMQNITYGLMLADARDDSTILAKNKKDVKEITQTINLFDKIFWNCVEKRNETMVEKTIMQMKLKNQHLTSLVVGGLHEKGLKIQLDKYKINYIVLEPIEYTKLTENLK